MKKPRSQSDWLSDITPDQNLEDIDDIVKTTQNGAKRWFPSRVLRSIINFGHLNPATKRVVLGMQSPETGITFSTAAVQSMTHTVPTGERHRIYYAAAVNITQASTVSLTGTIGGYTFAVPMVIGAPTAQDRLNGVIGVGLSAGVSSGNNDLDELWLEAGDSISVNVVTFAAGNNTEHVVLFEKYRV